MVHVGSTEMNNPAFELGIWFMLLGRVIEDPKTTHLQIALLIPQLASSVELNHVNQSSQQMLKFNKRHDSSKSIQ